MSKNYVKKAILATNIWINWKGINWGEIQDDFSLFKMGNVSLDKRSEVLNSQTTLAIIKGVRVYIAMELETCLVNRVSQKRTFQGWSTNSTEKRLVKNQCKFPNDRMRNKKLTFIEATSSLKIWGRTTFYLATPKHLEKKLKARKKISWKHRHCGFLLTQNPK